MFKSARLLLMILGMFLALTSTTAYANKSKFQVQARLKKARTILRKTSIKGIRSLRKTTQFALKANQKILNHTIAKRRMARMEENRLARMTKKDIANEAKEQVDAAMAKSRGRFLAKGIPKPVKKLYRWNRVRKAKKVMTLQSKHARKKAIRRHMVMGAASMTGQLGRSLIESGKNVVRKNRRNKSESNKEVFNDLVGAH